MDQLAGTWNRGLPQPKPSLSESERTIILKAYADHISESLLKNVPEDQKLYDRIKDLEKQVADAHKAPAQVKKDSNHALGPFARTEEQPKILAVDGPSSKAPKEVTAWINRVLKKADQKGVPQAQEAIKELNNNIADKDLALETGRLALVDWGMPISIAAIMEAEQANRILATISLIA